MTMPMPSSPQPPKRRGKVVLIVALLVCCAAIVAGAWGLVKKRAAPRTGVSAPVEGITQTPAERPDAPKATISSQLQGEPAIFLEVRNAAGLRRVVASNGWVARVLEEPLGRGFLGGWGPFLGTRGSDVGEAFTGTVLDFLLDRILATPFEVVWYGGQNAPGSPVVVVPGAGGSAKAAFEVLDRIGRQGTVTSEGCHAPGEASADAVEPFVIARWLIAEHPLFAAVKEGDIFFSRDVNGVVQASCGRPQASETEADVALTFLPLGLGREAEQLSLLTGLHAPRFEFAIEGERLVSRGIAGPANDARLGTTKVPDGFWRVVPENLPVVVSLGLKLPKSLDAESVAAHFEKPDGRLERQAALLWNPRGRRTGVETALVWSRVEDLPELQRLFSEPWTNVCGVLVLSSSDALTMRMKRACAGQAPSVLNAAKSVSDGLRESNSVAVALQPGQLLAQILADAYLEETQAKTLPTQIEEARRLLSDLPVMGFSGRVKGKTLLPRGFGS